MSTFAALGLGVAGFAIGNLLFARIGRWLLTIQEIRAEAPTRESRSKWKRLAAATLLSSGPWLAIVAGIFLTYIRAEAWALPLYVGIAVALAFFGAIALFIIRKGQRNAA